MKILKMKNMLLPIMLFFILSVMALIFYFSSQTAEQSNELSKRFSLEIFLRFLSSNFSEPERSIVLLKLNHITRKVAHFLSFSILGVFLYSTFLVIKRCKRPFLYSMCIGLIYAISDELHQLFVSGRGAQIEDVLLDFTGIITGIALIAFISFHWQKGFFRKFSVKPCRKK